MNNSSASRVGLGVVWNNFGLGVLPVVGFPATEPDREKAASETGKAVVLVTKASPVQRELLTHLAQIAPDNTYFSPDSRWIETVMKAVADLSHDDIKRVYDLDWTPRNVTVNELKKQIADALKRK
jgi:hypothetical protein